VAGPVEPTPTRLRPYSSPSTAGATPRSAEFNTGLSGDDPGNSPTSLGQDSLNINAQQFRDQVPAGFRPTSVLQQTRPSMNAESAQDYARVLPGGYRLPTANGQSQSSWETSNILRMQGQDSE
jgi:hypothetical protein